MVHKLTLSFYQKKCKPYYYFIIYYLAIKLFHHIIAITFANAFILINNLAIKLSRTVEILIKKKLITKKIAIK